MSTHDFKWPMFILCSALTFIALIPAVLNSKSMVWPHDKTIPVNPFRTKIVHLDLKGAPPHVEYLEEFFAMLAALKVDGVLMEYEDMFPYWDDLAVLRSPNHYSIAEIERINKACTRNNLELIPLVQTFGHMEFVLKQPPFMHLREANSQNTICPSDDQSKRLIKEMLAQVKTLHPNSRSIHIGSDEANMIGKDKRCRDKMVVPTNLAIERLKLDHISSVAKYALEMLNVSEVLAWNDLFGDTDVDLLIEFEMDKLITPVIWGYSVNVTTEGYFPEGVFERYSKVFSKMLFGSAFKGANGHNMPFINIERYLLNHESFVELYKKHLEFLEGRIDGIIITGWQRYSHFDQLCELLPVAIPSLVVDLMYLNDITLSRQEIMLKALKSLNCSNIDRFSVPENVSLSLMNEKNFEFCSFPGSKLYNEMQNFERLNSLYQTMNRTDAMNNAYSNTFKVLALDLQNAMRPVYSPATASEILHTSIAVHQLNAKLTEKQNS